MRLCWISPAWLSTTVQLALSSFLAWFDGSQALERIIKLERRRHFSGEVVGGVVTTLLYMIKRVQYSQIYRYFVSTLFSGVWQTENDSSKSEQGKVCNSLCPLTVPSYFLSVFSIANYKSSRTDGVRTCCQAVKSGTHRGCWLHNQDHHRSPSNNKTMDCAAVTRPENSSFKSQLYEDYFS